MNGEESKRKEKSILDDQCAARTYTYYISAVSDPKFGKYFANISIHRVFGVLKGEWGRERKLNYSLGDGQTESDVEK